MDDIAANLHRVPTIPSQEINEIIMTELDAINIAIATVGLTSLLFGKSVIREAIFPQSERVMSECDKVLRSEDLP